MKNPILSVFLVILIDLIGVGIIIPILPQLFTVPDSSYYLLSGFAESSRFLMYGLLIAAYPIAAFFAAPVLGQLSDRYGRKPVLVASLAGTALGYVLLALGVLTRSVTLLFIGRVVDGITGGNISVAQAAIADSTEPRDRAKNFGLIGAAFGVGFVIGPFIGGILASPSVVSWFNPATPLWTAALLTILNVLLLTAVFTETNNNRSAIPFDMSRSVRNVARAWSFPSLRALFTTSFLYQAGFSFFTTFFSVFLIARFSVSELQIGNFFAFLGVCIVITQAVIVRRIARSVEPASILKVSIPLSALGIVGYFVSGSYAGVFLIAPISAIGNGLTLANMNGLISSSAGSEAQGEVLGINASVQSLAQALPPVLAAVAASALGAAAPLLVAASAMAAGWLVFLHSYRPAVFHEPVDRAA